MKLRGLILSIIITTMATIASAHAPLYVVNGVVVESIEHIPHENIESIEMLPADEETVAKWGIEASDGVIVVQLRYDTPASFSAAGYDSFTTYLSKSVKWSDNMEVARVSLRLRVDAEGRASISEVLQATSRQLLNRVEKAIARAPLWSAAQRNGKAVESIVLINLQLPEGRKLPTERGIILL